MFDNRQKALIRALIYPVQFARDPVDDVDRVLDLIVSGGALGGDAAEYAAAVDAGLASDEQLADLIPQAHPEPVIRTYLAELRKRLPAAPAAGA